MEKRKYTRIQALLRKIRAMLAVGKALRQVAEYSGFQNRQVIKRPLERERRKKRKLDMEILPRPKGRSGKDAVPRDIVAKQAYEIQRMHMENELMRDFLRSAGRR